MSPRAACRLERLGFEQVYDYVPGIADWKAAGLATDGEAEHVDVVADATRPDIPTCRSDESIGEARSRTFDAGWDECVVVDCDELVVGRLRNDAWEVDPGSTAADVMEPGPTTVRPNQALQPLVERMARRGTRLVVVTTPQGELIGALLRSDAERLLTGVPPEQIWQDCDGCPGGWRAMPASRIRRIQQQ